MKLSDLITPGRTLANVEARSKKHALEILSELLAGALPAEEQDDEPPADTNAMMSALVQREKLGCTGLGGGVALPHGTVHGARGAAGACIRLSTAVEYDNSDGDPVDLLVAIIAGDPASPNEQHILHLASAALRNPECLAKLRQASDSMQMHDALKCLDRWMDQVEGRPDE